MEEKLNENPQTEELKEDAIPQESDVVSNQTNEQKDPLDKSEPIIVEDENSRPYDEVIEEARKKVLGDYNKQKRISNISMIVVVALLIGCFVLIFLKNITLNIVGYSLTGALIVGMIIFYFVTKNKIPNKIRDYIMLVTKTINAHVFKDGSYKELKSDPTERLEIGEVVADGVYEDIESITSRNVVEGLYEGRTFKVADAALRKGRGRATQNIFVGKYFSYPNNLHFEGRYVILSKRKGGETDIPNAINDLAVLSEEEEFVVYGPNQDAKINKDTNSKLVSLIKAIEKNNYLMNVVVVIWAGHSAAYLSYSDDIIALPFEKAFNKEAFEQYTSQQLQLLNALKTLL